MGISTDMLTATVVMALREHLIPPRLAWRTINRLPFAFSPRFFDRLVRATPWLSG
jgi:hypothetical protein